ncbi:MAG: ABC transporter ATP-binding protein [Christensenellaceae bacterium]
MMSIEIKNLSFEIDGKKILQEVNLDFTSGFIGVIGPNGAGKTTLLRHISGYVKAQSGSVLLDGMPIGRIDIKTLAKKMALVPQNYALEYDFTVLETVLMGRNPHKKAFESDNEDDFVLAHACIEKAGIKELENRSIIGLSGGEWQRMIIARALCQQSNVLLLDEPVSNLDIKHQVGILDMVRDLVKNNGLLCVCVLHDLNLAYNYCDSIALMKNGRVHCFGECQKVMTKEILEEVYDTKINLIKDGSNTYILPVMKR